MPECKQSQLLEKYLNKKRKQNKRDQLLSEIAELSQRQGIRPNTELIKKRIKKKQERKAESFEDKIFGEDIAVDLAGEDTKNTVECSQDEPKVYQEDNIQVNKPDIPNKTQEIESIISTTKKEDINLQSSLNQHIEQNNDSIIINKNTCTNILQEFTLQRMRNRKSDIQNNREKLAIFYDESRIVSAIKNYLVTLIRGETGCGKTTQIPQFLLEHGFCKYGRICTTQPRRISAITVSARINEELNEPLAGYKIKYENTIKKETKIKFVTEGVLLREISCDFLLNEYSVIILDEIHERSINMDLLIGLLSRIVRVRSDTQHPLRLVLMSATACFDSVNHLFNNPPLIELDSHKFKVSLFYESKNPEYYLDTIEERIGSILSASSTAHKRIKNKNNICDLPDKLENNKDAAILVFLPSKSDIYNLKTRLDQNKADTINLPLHSGLTRLEQDAVYKQYKVRKIILATNIAETSITIPDVVIVIDSGLVKYRMMDEDCLKYQIGWISKSSAEQRMGRAGRVGPGACFRIYSGATYERFVEHSMPEIYLEPLDGTYLYLKSLGIKKIDSFPFANKIESCQLEAAAKTLQQIGAINQNDEITDVGMALSRYPLSPRIANILVIASKYQEVYREIHLIASILAIGLEIRRNSKTDEFYLAAGSDLIVALRIIIEYCRRGTSQRFASAILVSKSSLDEIIRLANYLMGISDMENRELSEIKLTHENETKICKVLFRVFGDHIAIKSGEGYLNNGREIMVSKEGITPENSNFVFECVVCGRNQEYAKNITIIQPEWYR